MTAKAPEPMTAPELLEALQAERQARQIAERNLRDALEALDMLVSRHVLKRKGELGVTTR